MVTTLQTGGLLGCLLSGISDKPARRKFDRGEAGDTSSATTLRGKFPKVAVEYTGPDRIHQVRPNLKRVCERQRCTLFSMARSAVLGFKVLSQMN